MVAHGRAAPGWLPPGPGVALQDRAAASGRLPAHERHPAAGGRGGGIKPGRAIKPGGVRREGLYSAPALEARAAPGGVGQAVRVGRLISAAAVHDEPFPEPLAAAVQA